MISHIKLCFKHNGRVDGRKKISFNPGLNVVIGPNGSGKSSLLEASKHQFFHSEQQESRKLSEKKNLSSTPR